MWVLSGEHRGTLANVYAVWKERGAVRVDLGCEAKEKVRMCIASLPFVATGERGPMLRRGGAVRVADMNGRR